MSYVIDEHKHRYSAWTASRTSSVKGCRIKVADGKDVIEAIALDAITARTVLLQLDSRQQQTRSADRGLLAGLSVVHTLSSI